VNDYIERIGGWEEAVPDVYEDQAFYAKVCLVAPVFVESECYCKYRKHPNSLCAAMKKTGQYPVVRQIFLNWLEVYMSRQQVQNGEVWAALHKELWPYRHPALRRISKYGKSRINQIKAFLKLCAQWILPVHIHQWLKARLQRQVG
jgi:hypothetical protein